MEHPVHLVIIRLRRTCSEDRLVLNTTVYKLPQKKKTWGVRSGWSCRPIGHSIEPHFPIYWSRPTYYWDDAPPCPKCIKISSSRFLVNLSTIRGWMISVEICVYSYCLYNILYLKSVKYKNSGMFLVLFGNVIGCQCISIGQQTVIVSCFIGDYVDENVNCFCYVVFCFLHLKARDGILKTPGAYWFVLLFWT